MTLEEAIDILAESKRQNEVMRDNPSTFWASHQMADGVKNAERRIAALEIALTALRPVSRELVEKVWRGEWILELVGEYKHLKEYHCSECGYQLPLNPTKIPIFCENCGSPLTDEAVEIVMERLEALKDADD